MIFSTMLTGLLFILLGKFKASGLVRYIPYPVVGGFLAGTGLLLAKGALGVMVDIPITLANLPTLIAPQILWLWLPGVLLGIALYLITRYFNHFLVLPGTILAAIAVFYTYLLISGISIEQAGANGWLLGPFPQGGLFQPFTLDNLQRVEWGVIFSHSATFATIFGLSAVSLLLNVSGVELIIKKDLDLDRELISAGAANIFGSLSGSVVGFQALSLTALVTRFKINNRLAGLITALLAALALFFGASVISYFPKPILGGLLFFLGLAFLLEWLVDSFKLLPRMDYALIWVMLIVIDRIGFLAAIGTGIMISALMFVISYGRMSVVKNVFYGGTLHSRVERSQRHRNYLDKHGDQIHILILQGFIFFGSVQGILGNIRKRMSLKDEDELKYLVLDFREVKRLDSSAIFGVTRLKQLVESGNIAMAWSGISDAIREHMERGGLLQGQGANFSIHPTLDHALEWCENKLLENEKEQLTVDIGKSILASLNRSFPGITRLTEFTERVEIQPGEYFIRQGESSNDLFYIESGLVTVEFETAKGEVMRLRSVKSGATLGEIALYLGGVRTASVKAEERSVIHRLSIENLRRMHKEDPALASVMHEWIARSLAERLAENNQMIEVFMD
jgi:SulP family sulfate permease